MTTPTSLPPPPYGDDTDAAISARLDGELAAFAADHDATEAEVAAALDGWPGTAARVEALEQARAAVATPVAPLDDLARRRLVQGALAPRDDALPAPRTRAPRGSWWGIAAAAVVAILVVVAIGAMVVTDDGSSSNDQATSGGAESAVAGRAPDGELGDVGDVSDPAALRALLEGRDPTGRRESAGDAAPPAAATDGAGGESADQGLQSRTPGDGSAAFDANKNTVDPADCAAQLAGSRPVRFVGTGVYGGLPVVVVGLDQGGRTIAFVVPVGDCTTVLTSVSR